MTATKTKKGKPTTAVMHTSAVHMVELKKQIDALQAQYDGHRAVVEEGLEAHGLDDITFDIQGEKWKAYYVPRTTESVDKPALFAEYGEAAVRRFIKSKDSNAFYFRPIKPGVAKT